MGHECSYTDKEYPSVEAFMRDAFNAPLMGCFNSNTGHCRFKFNSPPGVPSCAYRGDSWRWDCGKWITEPTHQSRKYKHSNERSE